MPGCNHAKGALSREWRYEGLSPAGLPLFAFLYFPSCSWKALLSSHWRREPRETNINPVKGRRSGAAAVDPLSQLSNSLTDL